ncbi:uncharacterized protein LOC135402783 [Pseudopipra pipra]|uniref:uncharacterized protein LOC135402783 n=1 Tax=Pseudopipra pipra TaxID=415032 RepID=UPI003139A8D1
MWPHQGKPTAGAWRNLDISSQSTTIVHQIFGGFLRSRVICFSCKAISDSYEAFLDVPLDIKAASSLTAALEDFVTPEHLDGENCFKCSKCEKNVAATKRFTVHRAPKVLTVCLKRFDCFTGGKISKVVEYPEYLDLRPYMSQADGEALLYSLYAVLVHSGVSCHGGHYFCYTKASNGLWYRMDDESVELCSIDTVLRQQAYLLFYARCSDLRIGERASSSLAPSHAPSFLSQCVASSKQAGSVGPQGLTGRTKGMKDTGRERSRSRSPLWGRDLRSWSVDTTDYDDSSERRTGPPSRDRGPRDSTAARPSKRICRWAPAPRAAQEQTLLRQREPSRSVRGTYNLCRKDTGRERSRSRSPLWGRDLRSWSVDTTDYDDSSERRTGPPSRDRGPRDSTAARPSKRICRWAPAPRAAQEQTLLRQREPSRSVRGTYNLCRKDTGRERSRSRSPLWGRDLRSWSVDTTDYDDSSERRTGPPSRDRGPRDSTAARPSKRICRWAPAPRAAQEQTLLRQREPSRSVQGTYNLRSRFVPYTDYDRSLRKRKRERTSPPRCDQVLVNTAVPGPSKASSKQALMLRAAQEQTRQRQREQRRSTWRGYDCHSQFGQYTDYRPSEKKRRVSTPQRFTSDKHSGHSGNDGIGLWPWLKQNGRLALRLLAKASLFSTRLLKPE